MTPLFTFTVPVAGNIEVFSEYNLGDTYIRHTRAAIAATSPMHTLSNNTYMIKNFTGPNNKTPRKKVQAAKIGT